MSNHICTVIYEIITSGVVSRETIIIIASDVISVNTLVIILHLVIYLSYSGNFMYMKTYIVNV